LTTLEKLLQDATAGDPMTGLKWMRKTCRNLAKELKRKGFQVEHSTIPRLARLLKYTLRVNHKRLSRQQDDRRDQQIQYIERQRKRFARKKQPEIEESILNRHKRLLTLDFTQKRSGVRVPLRIAPTFF
jgi:phosphoribosyl-dephospho-CoA transferase